MMLRSRLLTCAALGGAMMLAGCQDDSGLLSGDSKANKPLKQELLDQMQAKGMSKSSPVLVRIFKEDSKLEIWKQNDKGRYALLKDYKICAWGGKIGPKVKQGDYQSPEGFYSVRPSQMNPRSSYYLSFDVGFPNAFDRAWGRSGGDIMVHGDCSSSGCFAMTDKQVEEIYGIVREAFAGGQDQVQVQSFPFPMTPKNMARVRNSEHFAFWKNLKEGYDQFEETRLEPKVDVCDKHYVFNAELPSGAVSAFNPVGPCPAYQTRADVALALQSRTAAEAREFETVAATLEEEEKAKAKAAAELAAKKAKEEEEARLAALKPKSTFSLFASNDPAPSPLVTGSAGTKVQAAPSPKSAPPAPVALAPVKQETPWWKRLNPF